MVWFLFRFVVINLSLLTRFRTFRRIKMVLRHVQYLFCNSWDALWPCVRYVRVRVCRVQAACVRVRGASGAKQFKSFLFPFNRCRCASSDAKAVIFSANCTFRISTFIHYRLCLDANWLNWFKSGSLCAPVKTIKILFDVVHL